MRLQEGLTRTRYRSGLPTMRRRFVLRRESERLAATGLGVDQLHELADLASDRSREDPGALLAHWLDGEPPRWREVLDERAAKGRQAAARERVAPEGGGEPMVAASVLERLMADAAAGRTA